LLNKIIYFFEKNVLLTPFEQKHTHTNTVVLVYFSLKMALLQSDTKCSTDACVRLWVCLCV